MVDKNLFLYDLAIVAIMKGEEHYVKEWLDYHLLAGVDHFYIYDNDSTPEFKKILQPYIDANIVNYIHYPGKARQFEAYNDAFKRVRFECRYIAWIDTDEFIFPKSKSSAVEILDEVIAKNPNAGGLVINHQHFGSNYQDKADYSRGVLDRFTRRAPQNWAPPLFKNSDIPGGNSHVKTIANPRKIDFFNDPHHAKYLLGFYSVNTDGNPSSYRNQFPTLSYPIMTNKMVLNHYHFKSHEEYDIRGTMGRADYEDKNYRKHGFNHEVNNDEVDEDIIKYRDARRAALIKDADINAIFPRKQINATRLFNALAQNLVTTTVGSTPRNFYEGKIENFLTCLHLSGYLRGKLLDDGGAKIFEELSLNALYKSMVVGSSIADILLLIDELPKILELYYPAVKKIRDACINIIPQVMLTLRMNNQWQNFTDLDYTLKLLKKIN